MRFCSTHRKQGFDPLETFSLSWIIWDDQDRDMRNVHILKSQKQKRGEPKCRMSRKQHI